MSLVLKCQCGQILKFEIANPGLMRVKPCERCLQKVQEWMPAQVRGWEDPTDAIDSEQTLPGYKQDINNGPGTAEFDEQIARELKMQRASRTDNVGFGDDDNDPRNPVDRRLA